MTFSRVSLDGYLPTPPATPPDDIFMSKPYYVAHAAGGDASNGSCFTGAHSATDMESSIGHKSQNTYNTPLRQSTFANLNAKSSPSSGESFRRVRALKSKPTGTNKAPCGSLRSPDRFLPASGFTDATVKKFHTNKDPQQLSWAEKILRNIDASPDAFFPRKLHLNLSPPGADRRSSSQSEHLGGPTDVGIRHYARGSSGERQASIGTVWAVGGVPPVDIGVPNGRGRRISSGTNAPLYSSSFSNAATNPEDEYERHEERLALALDLDRAQRILQLAHPGFSSGFACRQRDQYVQSDARTTWGGSEWISEAQNPILDAPHLRDDFYCSVLAYSTTCHTLVVGLGAVLYAWSESQDVRRLSGDPDNGSWLTSIAFSSTQGCKCILAYGRSDGTLTLMSLYDGGSPRFEVHLPCPIACVTWKPTVTLRPSHNPLTPGMLVKNEDLLIGDDVGNVYYYSVEWPDAWEVERSGWPGVVTPLVRISAHSQQICGMAWSIDGTYFATGGNDNVCCLFEAAEVIYVDQDNDAVQNGEELFAGSDGIVRHMHSTGAQGQIKTIILGSEKHRWPHGAAVKAIAFCPWREGLVATGGGSNDKCIHFYHTISGTCLATISVAAQVTSLVWSTTRREIAATFGYAQPEHPYRIAVFSWPECRQIAAIPWEGQHRALYAIAYPGGPNDGLAGGDGGGISSRTRQEGCIVVAASDESVKFHEVWSAGQKATLGAEGLLGGSDILEGMEGIDKEGDIIR